MCFVLYNLEEKKEKSNLSLFVTPGFLNSHWMLKVWLNSRGERWAHGREVICTEQLYLAQITQKWKFWGAEREFGGNITYWISLNKCWYFKDKRWTEIHWSLSFPLLSAVVGNGVGEDLSFLWWWTFFASPSFLVWKQLLAFLHGTLNNFVYYFLYFGFCNFNPIFGCFVCYLLLQFFP